MKMKNKICSVPSPTLRIASQSLSLSGVYNSGYEATAFGFRPNPRYVRTSHIRKTLYAIQKIFFLMYNEDRLSERGNKFDFLEIG